MRRPLVTIERHLLQRPASSRRFALELGNEQLRQRHDHLAGESTSSLRFAGA
jgi:hypothetical protein